MPYSLYPPGLHARATLSPDDITALLAGARMLQRAAQRGPVQPLLRGKIFGLLCEATATGHDDAALFCRSAVELGAHVAHIRPIQWTHGALQVPQDTARMLGRLYNAVECQGMPAEVVRGLRQHAAVPVFDGVASPHHPTAQVAELLDEVASPADRRRLVLQAVLLSTLADR